VIVLQCSECSVVYGQTFSILRAQYFKVAGIRSIIIHWVKAWSTSVRCGPFSTIRCAIYPTISWLRSGHLVVFLPNF
jgi:hypothetical protein